MFEFIHWPLYSQYTCREHGIQSNGYGDIRMLLECRCVLSSVGAEKGKWASLGESGDHPGPTALARVEVQQKWAHGPTKSLFWERARPGQAHENSSVRARSVRQKWENRPASLPSWQLCRGAMTKQVSHWEPVCTALWEWNIPRCLTLAMRFLKLTWR